MFFAPFDLSILAHALQSVMAFVLIGLLGYILAKRGWFAKETVDVIVKLVTQIALPMFLFHNINSVLKKDDLKNLVYVGLPFVSIFLTLGISVVLARLLGVAPRRRGIFYTSCSFSNTIYIGIPVNLALFGEESLPYVLLYYFGNTSLFWTFGNYCLSSGGELAKTGLFSAGTAKKIFSPPLLGFLAGLLLLLVDVKPPLFIANASRYFGGIATPLVILLIGVTIFNFGFRNIRPSRELAAVVIMRMLVCPLIMVPLTMLFPVPDLMRKVFILQSSLPAMSMIATFGAYYKSDPDYATVTVAVTTLISMITIPLYMMFLAGWLP